MTQKIFKEDVLNKTFAEKGYIKLKLIDDKEADAIAEAIKKYYANHIQLSETLSVSLWSNSLELKFFADKLIKEHLEEKVNSYLINYESIWGDILIKKPHFTKSFGLHQDWTFVEEDSFTSINVWCPLQDVNYWNGCLQLVPKSHLFLDKIRGLNSIPGYHAINTEIKNKYAINIEAKKGEAVLFSHALLHASSPNRTLKNRISIGLNVKPKNIPITHYILNKKTNQISKYHVSKDYFLQIGQKTDFAASIKNGFIDYIPDGELIDIFPPDVKNISMKEFNQLIK